MSQQKKQNSNTTLVKVKFRGGAAHDYYVQIQIQHLLKLNKIYVHKKKLTLVHSNTTLVKVKCGCMAHFVELPWNSNTTLVKVKLAGDWEKSNGCQRFKYNTC